MTLATNLAKAQTYLATYIDAPVLSHIGGAWVPAQSGEVFETISPVDGQKLADIAKGDAADIDAAAQAAKAAFADWRDMGGAARRAVLYRIADLIDERAEEIALIESMDTGQALRFMSKDAVRGADNFRFFADKAAQARDGQSLQAPNQFNFTSRKPIGPVGIITPWNTPFMLSTWKIAPALAAGCTVVHKPAELSPLTAKILVEIAEEAGLPAGVWNLVNGFGEDAGKALTEHPDIKAIAIVGESQTGKHIMRQGADTLKRVHFELGGKNPMVVFADADLERAADAAVFMIYSLNGERCTSSSRVLVEASIYDAFVAVLADKAARLKVGHPLDPDTIVGPLINRGHEAKVLSYFDIARDEGVTIATGGKKLTYKGMETGCFVAPTLFTNARNDMRVAQEEIFGPVLTALSFDSEEQALAMANDVVYGLAGYVWTNDVMRALRFTDGMDAGMIWVNSENIRHLPTPFGGVKESGIGRDGGDWSFDFYMETKNVAFATAPRTVPKLGL
jgi:5-carboxymethyl-2-hydroxymuconic-semialdehyde dehydrogenase